MLLCALVLPVDRPIDIERLYRDYYSQMYGVAYKVLGSAPDAEEAVQEAFLKIMNSRERIGRVPAEKQVAYCLVVVRNQARNQMRGRRFHVDIDAIPYKVAEEVETEGDFIRREDAQRLMSAMRALKPDDYDLLYLRWIEGLGYRQIALLKNTAEETIRKRGQRAFHKLREMIEKEEQAV